MVSVSESLLWWQQIPRAAKEPSTPSHMLRHRGGGRGCDVYAGGGRDGLIGQRFCPTLLRLNLPSIPGFPT